MVTTGAAASTDSAAVPVAPDFVAVTVCGPAVVAVQVFAVHEPSGAMVNVAVPVTSPRLLPAASRPCAVNVRLAPASIVAVPGETVRWSSPPGCTVIGDWVAERVPSPALTDWLPAVRRVIPENVCVPASAAVNAYAEGSVAAVSLDVKETVPR